MRPARACVAPLAALSFLALAGPAEVAAQDPASAVYTACYVPLTGTVYRIKTANTRPACASPSHVEFSWNEEGPQGPPGPKGEKGEPGDAAAFTGTFSSPGGHYSLSVTDQGILLEGPTGEILLSGGGVTVRTSGSADVRVLSSADVRLHSDGESIYTSQDRVRILTEQDVFVQGTFGVAMSGAGIHLNGDCRGVSGEGDVIVGAATESPVQGQADPVVGNILDGSSTVKVC